MHRPATGVLRRPRRATSSSTLAYLAAMLATRCTLAQLPNFPHGGGACVTEDDCSLGGVCANSTCICDAWFTGQHCSYLNLQPADSMEAGLCGAGFASYYSWGGRSVVVNGTYHLYASFLCKHNTLSAWTTQSASAHFTSPNATGPFVWSPEQCTREGICTPVVIPWSHNTVAARNDSRGSSVQVWHIGDGIVPASDWYPCFNASEVGHNVGVPVDPPAAWGAGPGNTAYIAAAASPYGPWTREFNNSGVTINFTGSWTTALAGNPAPLFEADGSVKLYFTATPCPPNSGALAPNCIAVATAASWEGPYSLNAAPTPITYPESEDPSVFRDTRGNYHLLTNVNTYHARCGQGVPCGGHAWSRDGLHFSNLSIGAFGPVLTFTDGTTVTNAYVERPLVVTAEDGTPIAFHVGMGRTSYADSCNWVQLFCTPDAPACGPTLPPAPPAPVTVKLMNSGACLMFNASAFPCSGSGTSAGCPVVMGECSNPGALWWIAPDDNGDITSASGAGSGAALALDVDCDSTAPHTLVKVLASGPAAFTINATAGVIAYGGGMCLNTGQGPAVPPCGPPGEVWLPNQIQLAPCSDPSAGGWSVITATA